MRRLLRDALLSAALAAVYAALARVSLAAATAHHVVSSVWPPAGLAVFALVRFGLGLWPGVAAGAFLLNASSGVSPAGALMIAAGNTAEAVIATWLLMRVARMRRALDRVRDVLALVGFAGELATMVAASVGVAALALTGAAAPASAARLWLVWWTGDAVGVVVMAPFLFTWTEPEHDVSPRRVRVVEEAATFIALVGGAELLFQRWPGFVYLLFPAVAWIALRLGRRGAATASAVIMVIATWHTIRHEGPFTQFSPLGNLFALQLFLAVLAAKAMIFAAARAEAAAGHARVLATEARYRMLARNLPDACVVLYDRDIRLVLVEGPAVAAAGFVKEEVEGRTIAEIFDPDHALALVVPFRIAFEQRTFEFEFSYAGRIYLVRVLPLAEPGQPVAFGMALALDITRRHQSERELDEHRARLQALSRQLLAAQ